MCWRQQLIHQVWRNVPQSAWMFSHLWANNPIIITCCGLHLWWYKPEQWPNLVNQEPLGSGSAYGIVAECGLQEHVFPSINSKKILYEAAVWSENTWVSRLCRSHCLHAFSTSTTPYLRAASWYCSTVWDMEHTYKMQDHHKEDACLKLSNWPSLCDLTQHCNVYL